MLIPDQSPPIIVSMQDFARLERLSEYYAKSGGRLLKDA
jgi:hypothetical protein